MPKLALTETRNEATSKIDLMDSSEIARTLNQEDQKVALAVEKTLPAISEAIELIANCLKKGGRLGYFGAGTSGRLGVLDASECWPTFGIEAEKVCGYIAGGDRALRFSVEDSEDNAEFGRTDLTAFNPGPNDVVVAISSSGNPPYLLSVLEAAKKRGAHRISISCNPEAKIKDLADIFINPIVGSEPITGSSRMKAGTAQKMILNMLSTGAMIRIGKVYKNYMVDLRILNTKLLDRGIRIICDITGLPRDEAAEYLQASGNKVKTACVMAIKKCTKPEAEQLLHSAGGILRKIIE